MLSNGMKCGIVYLVVKKEGALVSYPYEVPNEVLGGPMFTILETVKPPDVAGSELRWQAAAMFLLKKYGKGLPSRGFANPSPVLADD